MFESDMMEHLQCLPTHQPDTAWNPTSKFLDWLESLSNNKQDKEE